MIWTYANDKEQRLTLSTRLTDPQQLSTPLYTPSTSVSDVSSSYEFPGNYVYYPLGTPVEIRLLELLPPCAEVPNQIHCRLIRTNLGDRLLYSAVSYTWGEDPHKDIIWIDGKLFEARRNVKRLLSELRHGATGQSRMLWIDSVCINQKDILERNAQVLLMGDIYKNANYVLAWLDQPADGYNRLHDALSVLNEASTWSKFDVGKLTSYQIAAFQWLFEHEYWQRQWIIQEIALARSVDLVSRGYQVPLSEVHAVLWKIYSYLDECYLNSLQRIPLRFGMRSPPHLLQLSQKKAHTNTRMKELLYNYKDNQCSDPRDNVFALLSLCPGAQNLLSADYAVKPMALMLSVFDFCLFHEDLHTRSMIGLGLLLRNQLQIATTTLDHCIRNGLFCTRLRATEPTLYIVTALVCGHVTSTKINPRWEPYVLHCRKLLGKKLPSLQSCCTNQLRELVGSDWKYHLHLQVSGQISEPSFGNGPGVGIHDLCAFEFQSPHSGSKSSLGLASTRVVLTDELWHFPKTPIALVARRDSSGSYSIVGRAYILRRPVPLGYPGPGETTLIAPNSVLDFAEDEEDHDTVGAKGDPTTKRVQHLVVDVPAFLALLKWADHG